MRSVMKMTLAVLIASAFVGGCGGGGSAAGTNPFGGNDSTSGNGGNSGSTAGGGLTNVSTGSPNQKTMSIALEKWGLDWGFVNDSTKIIIVVSDTAGNPIPDGTKVQFSVEGGQVTTSCILTGVANGVSSISTCTATFVVANPIPVDGKVTILAWLEGEEAFIDTNGNGKYDPGEPFYEGGKLFRDDNGDGIYEPGIDALVVGGSSNVGIGASPCQKDAQVFAAVSAQIPESVDNTCDGVWGKTYVRATVEVPVSYSAGMGLEQSGTDPLIIKSYSAAPSSTVKVAPPSGAALAVALKQGVTTACTGIEITPNTVPKNAVNEVSHLLNVTPAGCHGTATVTITNKSDVVKGDFVF